MVVRRRSARRQPVRPNYVSLGEWARANVFSVHWLERDKTVELQGRTARLQFNVESRSDARRAQINGVEVFLAFPILYQNGRAYISQIDLSETLGPVLSPPTSPRGINIKTICLDPGHGGNDPGYQVGSNDEKKYTLLLAEDVRTQLKAVGFNVVLTRTTDVKIPLEDRTAIARKAGADLFVCLHFNAFPDDRQVKGTEIYCCTPAGAYSFNSKGEGDTRWVVGNRNDEKNMLLAYQMMKSYEQNLGFEDRGVKTRALPGAARGNHAGDFDRRRLHVEPDRRQENFRSNVSQTNGEGSRGRNSGLQEDYQGIERE